VDWTIALNEKAWIYEVHAQGCFHLRAAHMDPMNGHYEGDPRTVAADFEAANEGCGARLGACARKVAASIDRGA
jgi:hypothetical protein